MIENRVTLQVYDFVGERIMVGTQSSTDRADDRQKRNVEQQQVHHDGFPQQSKVSLIAATHQQNKKECREYERISRERGIFGRARSFAQSS